MAIGSCTNINWRSRDLPIDIIVFLVQIWFERRKPQLEDGRVRPKVVIDANLVAYKHISNKSAIMPDGCVEIIARGFSENGIDVTIISDHPTKRHPSKRATCMRQGDKEKASIRRIKARMELEALLNIPPESRDHEAVKKLQTKIRSNENIENRKLPPDFVEKLDAFVESYDSEGKGNITNEQAPTQADPCAAKEAIESTADAIISGDSDFQMYVGPSGIDGFADLMLKDMKLNSRTGSIVSCKVVTGQKAVADRIDEILSPRLQKSAFKGGDAKVPTNPIFDGERDPMVRALLAMAVGCDACPGGVDGMGPQKALDLLNQVNKNLSGEALHDKLAEVISSIRTARVKDKDAVLCLAKSMLYEKTNHGYMYDEPAELEQYIADFAAENTVIVDGPEIATCKGCNGISHPFLASEEVKSCAQCKAVLCRFCGIDEKEVNEFSHDDNLGNDNDANENDSNDGYLCFDCARSIIAGDVADKSETEMRDWLKQKGQNVPATATYADVLDLYQQLESGELDFFDDDIAKVKFPILPTEALHRSKAVDYNIEWIKELPMRNIGELIHSEDVPIDIVLELVHLLASLTDIKARKKGEKLSYEHSLPKNLINMMRNARVHSGERLCKRSLRHAMDPATPDILNADLCLAKYGDKVCAIIDHKVKPSMKPRLYATISAFSATDLIATSCDCKSGCRNHGPSNLGKECVLCTHGATLPVELSQRMYTGVADHVLFELRRRVRRHDMNKEVSGKAMKKLRSDIRLLIKATGKPAPSLGDDVDLLEMLEDYQLTTELGTMGPGEPNRRNLGLLREKVSNYSRPEAAAEKTVKHKSGGANKGDNFAPPKDVPPATVEEYKAAQLLVDGLSLLFSTNDLCKKLKSNDLITDTPIGFKLLQCRANPKNDEPEGFDYSQQHQPRADMAEQLLKLLSLAEQRSLPKSPNSAKISNGPTPTTSASSATPLNSVTNSHKRKAKDPARSIGERSKRSHGESFHTCCVPWCKNTDATYRLTRVTDYPPELPIEASERRRITYHQKRFKREEITERLGLGRHCKESNLRRCTCHPMEIVTGKWVQCSFLPKGKQKIRIPSFEAPKSIAANGAHTPAKSVSKGTGTDRELTRFVKDTSQKEASMSKPTRVLLAREGMENDNASTEVKSSDEKPLASWQIPKFPLESLTAKEVKRLTGFRDLQAMLSFAAVVCGGDLERLTKRCTKMTWVEHWLLVFDFVWGRSKIRFQEFEKEYDCSDKTLRNALRQNLRMVLECRARWPMYASYDEDAKFRDRSWDRHFDPETSNRLFLHDSTNISMARPSAAEPQRMLWNSYYHECCAKAGVACQPCSYIYGLPLVTGHSDDDNTIEATKMFERQKAFADNDTSMRPGAKKPILNIFDKGYHLVLEALRNGQLCVQPDYDDGDQFKGYETLRSGCVAVVRAGNERAVKRCKMSMFLKRGTKDQPWDIDLLCTVWEAFTFQVNFMYEGFM